MLIFYHYILSGYENINFYLCNNLIYFTKFIIIYLLLIFIYWIKIQLKIMPKKNFLNYKKSIHLKKNNFYLNTCNEVDFKIFTSCLCVSNPQSLRWKSTFLLTIISAVSVLKEWLAEVPSNRLHSHIDSNLYVKSILGYF